MDRALIDRYEQGADDVRRSISGLSREQMTSRPVPGKWSVLELVMHLYHSDLIGSDRMHRVVAEDKPLLTAYDESRFTARLHYHDMDPALAAEGFRINRLLTAALLRALPDEAFVRTGVHTERGLLSLAQLVEDYTRHLEHHAHFMDEKRRALGVR